MHPLDPALDLDGARDWAPPADNHPLRGLGMHGHAVGLHGAGNPELLIRRVGDHPQRAVTAPAADGLPALDALDLLVEECGKLRLRHTDSQIRKPSRQQLRIDAVPPRQVCNRGLDGVGGDRRLKRCRLGHGCQAFRRGRGEPLPFRGERGRHLSHEPQRQVGPTGGHQPRVFPDDEIMITTVAGIAGAEADRDRILPFRHRERDANLLPIHQRRHRLHP